MNNIAAKIAYKSLNVPRDEIRLLILNPHDESDQVSCRIIHKALGPGSTQLDDTNNAVQGYEALSYEWGNPLDNQPISPGMRYADEEEQRKLHTIIVDGNAFGVRWNLYCALRQLRLADKPRVLWVDALCIDQENDQERNHQVTLMRMIYPRADRVVVWLGRNKWKSVNPLSRMKDFNDSVLRNMKTGERRDWSFDEMEVKYLSVWYGFLGVSYWNRLWIIQEVVLAKDIVLYLGEASATWEDFHRCCAEIDGKVNRLAQTSSRIPFLLNRQRDRNTPHEVPLFDLVLMFGKNLCTDIRDRIFGLHSLAPQCCRDSTPVEYAIPVSRKCEELTHHHLFEHYSSQKARLDTSSSVLIGVCRSIQDVIGITSSDYLKASSLGAQLAPIKVTGNLVGIVSLVASAQHVDALRSVEFNNKYHRRSVIKPIFQARILSALTPEIFRRLDDIKNAKKWHDIIPRFSVPPLVIRELPKSPEIPQLLRALPGKREQGQAQIWEEKWQHRVSIPKRKSHQSIQLHKLEWHGTDVSHLEGTDIGYMRGGEVSYFKPPSLFFSPFGPLSLSEFIAGIISHPPSNCKAFFCDSGMVGHTYADIREGDIIYEFQGTGAVFALRRIFDTYFVAAMGWNTFQGIGSGGLPRTAALGTGRPGKGRSVDRSVDFLFSMQTLMAVSAGWE
jgi:hypothetical protein